MEVSLSKVRTTSIRTTISRSDSSRRNGAGRYQTGERLYCFRGIGRLRMLVCKPSVGLGCILEQTRCLLHLSEIHESCVHRYQGCRTVHQLLEELVQNAQTDLRTTTLQVLEQHFTSAEGFGARMIAVFLQEPPGSQEAFGSQVAQQVNAFLSQARDRLSGF